MKSPPIDLIIPAKPSRSSDNVLILDRGDYTTCAINLHGATITSWRLKHEEQLFTSRLAIYDKKQPIRGGIVFVFPHFRAWNFGPIHGFARIMRWTVETPPHRAENGDVNVVLSLVDDDFSRSMWNYPFKLLYRITLQERQVHLDVTIKNNSKDLYFDCNLVFSMYIKVPDVTLSDITGLEGATYINDDGDSVEETEASINVKKSIDRMYHNTKDRLVLLNTVGNKYMNVLKTELPDTVIWNPWLTKTKEFRDLDDDEYVQMVCVQVGHAAEEKRIYHDSFYRSTAVLHVKTKRSVTWGTRDMGYPGQYPKAMEEFYKNVQYC